MLQTKTFQNGIRLLTIPVKEVASVSVLVLIKAGSRNENETTNGLAHFTEHMCFQGNDKWATKMAIGLAVDSIGAEYNGMTGKEYTGYYIKAENANLALGLDILSHMICRSKFESAEMEKEKGVIVEEIHYRDDVPQIKVGDMAMEMVFFGNPLGLSGAGEKESVLKFKREDFIKFHTAHYTPGNTIVVVAGSFVQEEAENLAGEYFGSMAGGESETFTPWRTVKTAEKVRIKEKDAEQTHLCLGMTSIAKTDPGRYVLSLLNVILGSGFSSRLFQKIREEQRIAYYIDSDMDAYTDTGIFTVSAGVNNEKLEPAVTSILAELEKLRQNPVLEKELRKAKDYLRGKLAISLEESLDQAMFYGQSLLLENRVRTVAEIMESIEKVTIGEITDMARRIFVPDNYKLAVCGKGIDKEELDKILG